MKYLMCILLPPVACWMAGKKGAAWLNVVLTLCLWLPGMIHAFAIVMSAENEKRQSELLAALNAQKAAE